jgi:hypothetical protein
MALDFRTKRVTFAPTTGGVSTQNHTVNFDSRVRIANAAIQSFNMGYRDGDHNIWRQEVEIKNIRRDGGTGVNFDIDFLFRDSSGNIDDRYDGWVEVLVMADVA